MELNVLYEGIDHPKPGNFALEEVLLNAYKTSQSTPLLYEKQKFWLYTGIHLFLDLKYS